MAARVQLRPAQAKAGDVVEVRLIIGHPMESGQRRNDAGARIRRNIINKLTASYDGRVVFSADIGTGIAANPLFSFPIHARRTGPIAFEWVDDDGVRGDTQVELVVTA